MSQFKKLYDYCQTLEPKIKRNVVRDKALQIVGRGKIACIKLALDTTAVRGLFFSVSDTENRFVQQLGCDVIALPRGLNQCWDRFIFVKELMHLFDNDEEKTSNPDQFGALLAEFETMKPADGSSPQFDSEIAGVWMAAACLCPEKHRLELLAKYEAKAMNQYEIALKLKIPEHQVRTLFHPSYKDVIGRLLG